MSETADDTTVARAVLARLGRATRAMYPEGAAVRGNDIPLSRLEPALDYEMVVAAGAHGERVDDPDDLSEALARAVHAVTVERRQALLNVICAEG
jgi:acetolactate synthase-1/2/3 large subunit